MSENLQLLPEGLTKGTLAQVLKKEFGDVHVRNITATSGSTAGDNNLSEVSRIAVTFTQGDEEREKSFIIKDVKKAASDFAQKVNVTEKEMIWYEQILPEVEQLKINFGPKCYFKHNQWLLLEDLKDRGFKVLDRKAMLDLEHCLKAVEALAQFHATTHHLYKSDKLPEIAKKDTLHTIENKTLIYENFQIFDKIAASLDKMGETKYSKIIRNLKSETWERMQQCIDENQEFLSLVHGDYWTTNILFNYDQQGNVSNAKIIDYQLIRLLTPAFDLHFFVCTSVKPEVRDNHLNEIHSKYLETLNSTLKLLNSNTNISQEKFDKMMKGTHFMGLFIALTFLPVPLCESPLQFRPPDDLPEKEKLVYKPFDIVLQQQTYRKHLLSMLQFYERNHVI